MGAMSTEKDPDESLSERAGRLNAQLQAIGPDVLDLCRSAAKVAVLYQNEIGRAHV